MKNTILNSIKGLSITPYSWINRNILKKNSFFHLICFLTTDTPSSLIFNNKKIRLVVFHIQSLSGGTKPAWSDPSLYPKFTVLPLLFLAPAGGSYFVLGALPISRKKIIFRILHIRHAVIKLSKILICYYNKDDTIHK